MQAGTRATRGSTSPSPERNIRSTPWTALALLLVLVLPSAGSGEEEGAPDYARNGFYVGFGGVFLYPADWDGDFEDSDFENSAGKIATNNAAAALEAIDEDARLEPPEVLITTSGVDLDELWGAGAVVGYRASPHLALEFEGEWIADSSESSFTIDNTGDRGKIEVDDLWTVTANVRVYPFTGRFQPFGIVGFGLYHADVDARGESNGNTTTGINDDPPPPDDLYEDIPADFSYRSSKTKTDGVLRAGLGLDAYVTPEIAIETKVDYVLPFTDTGLITTDYLSVRVGVLYRF